MNVHDLRRASLALLLGEFSAAELHRMTGIAASRITRYKADPVTNRHARNMDEATARRLESACRKLPGWMDKQHPSGGAYSSGSLAHDLSHPIPMIDIPTTEWESIKMPAAAIPAQFMLKVKDDAMSWPGGDGLAVGDFAVFDRERAPRPGKNVLLIDRTGYVCIRRYREIRPGHWLAEPANPAYQTMDSIADGLQVFAAQVGHHY